MDYADAKKMWERAKTSDRTTNICAPPHYLRGDKVIRRMLAEGYVGTPLNVVIQAYSEDYANPDAPLHWRQDGAVSGYNTLVRSEERRVGKEWRARWAREQKCDG